MDTRITIRPATAADLSDAMRIYDAARQTMRYSGNLSQWINGYPSRDLVADDIEQGVLYVAELDGEPHGVFMFSTQPDPTYARIVDGAWANDEPYGVIHRIGHDGALRGFLQKAVEFALQRADNVRIDTHADNAIMQHVLAKAGFVPCGTVFCHDGTPRLAFQLVNR